MESIEEVQEKLEKVLKKKRYQHTLGVRYTAQALAMCHGEDIKMAGLAGVLHDCAKYMSDEEILAECEKYGIEYSTVEKKQPHLLHAKLGAYYAGEKYGVREEQIISSIRWHTTGKPDMTDFEKIIFIADYIEPNRKMLPNMEKIREVSFQNLDKAMYLILENTLTYLRGERMGSQEPIDPYTVEAYEYYKKIQK